MQNPEVVEHILQSSDQTSVDARVESDQNIIWENVFTFVNTNVDTILDQADNLHAGHEEYFQRELRALVVATYNDARSYTESRSVSTSLLILYLAKAFQYNEVMFSEEGVTNILKAAEII